MKGKLQFLGTGSSVGVPLLGCPCAICHSKDPHNKRLRSSVLLSVKGKKILIDVGPDFREQALKFGVIKLDGVIITHTHYDHTAGFDDLRPLCFGRDTPLPILASLESAKDIERRFYYLFPKEGAPSSFEIKVLPDQQFGKIDFEHIPIQFVTYVQGKMSVNGFRCGDLAYLCDIRHFSEEIFESLSGINKLVISALKFVPSPLHLSIDEAVDFAVRTGAKQVWLTHLSHEIEYQQTNAYLKECIRVAYDGLEIDFDMT